MYRSILVDRLILEQFLQGKIFQMNEAFSNFKIVLSCAFVSIIQVVELLHVHWTVALMINVVFGKR